MPAYGVGAVGLHIRVPDRSGKVLLALLAQIGGCIGHIALRVEAERQHITPLGGVEAVFGGVVRKKADKPGFRVGVCFARCVVRHGVKQIAPAARQLVGMGFHAGVESVQRGDGIGRVNVQPAVGGVGAAAFVTGRAGVAQHEVLPGLPCGVNSGVRVAQQKLRRLKLLALPLLAGPPVQRMVGRLDVFHKGIVIIKQDALFLSAGVQRAQPGQKPHGQRQQQKCGKQPRGRLTFRSCTQCPTPLSNISVPWDRILSFHGCCGCAP